MYQNATTVVDNIQSNPDFILDNFKANLFHTISGSTAVYAQIYYKDFINLAKVLGGVVYQTLVRKTELVEGEKVSYYRHDDL